MPCCPAGCTGRARAPGQTPVLGAATPLQEKASKSPHGLASRQLHTRTLRWAVADVAAQSPGALVRS